MYLKLLETKEEAPNTFSFLWNANKDVTFKPGQYFYFTLPILKYDDSRGNTRHFTISSSPTEEHLKITTRIREQSGFKKTLSELSTGSKIFCEGPSGNGIDFSKSLVKKMVFFAGGIGITPLRSMVKYCIDTKINIPFYLIYSNSDNNFIFRNELDNWSKDFPLRIKYLNTEKFSHLKKSSVSQLFANWGLDGDAKTTYWISGPISFVDSVEDILLKIGVNSDVITSDKFTGY